MQVDNLKEIQEQNHKKLDLNSLIKNDDSNLISLPKIKTSIKNIDPIKLLLIYFYSVLATINQIRRTLVTITALATSGNSGKIILFQTLTNKI